MIYLSQYWWAGCFGTAIIIFQLSSSWCILRICMLSLTFFCFHLFTNKIFKLSTKNHKVALNTLYTGLSYVYLVVKVFAILWLLYYYTTYRILVFKHITTLYPIQFDPFAKKKKNNTTTNYSYILSFCTLYYGTQINTMNSWDYKWMVFCPLNVVAVMQFFTHGRSHALQ